MRKSYRRPTAVQFGHAFDSYPNPIRQIETSPLLVTYSDQGSNGLSVNFQRHLRDNIVTWTEGSLPRPVHYNCWEAIYFEHDSNTLSEIIELAADIGAERFVLTMVGLELVMTIRNLWGIGILTNASIQEVWHP